MTLRKPCPICEASNRYELEVALSADINRHADFGLTKPQVLRHLKNHMPIVPTPTEGRAEIFAGLGLGEDVTTDSDLAQISQRCLSEILANQFAIAIAAQRRCLEGKGRNPDSELRALGEIFRILRVVRPQVNSPIVSLSEIVDEVEFRESRLRELESIVSDIITP